MKSMKLVLENWNRYVEEEEKQEIIEEGVFKNLALALGLMLGSPAMGSTPTPEPATTTQVVKISDKEIDQTLQELSEIARQIHSDMSAESIGAAKDKVEDFKKVSSKLEGIVMTEINALLDKLVLDAVNAFEFKGSDPKKFYELFGNALYGLDNFARHMERLSYEY